MDKRFSRLEELYGLDKVKKLENSKVLVIGLGGVGGYVVESLARSNIGSLILVDSDCVDITNINRQIIATNDTVGSDTGANPQWVYGFDASKSWSGETSSNGEHTHTIGNTGNGLPLNIMPPYQTVYMWRRTA